MSIRTVCPNGHAIKVKEKYAGKTGLCPICRARVKVPEVDVFADDSIMDVLQPEQSGLSGFSLDIPKPDEGGDWGAQGEKKPDATEKICAKCHETIPGDARICPHCRTYVARLQD